MLLPAVHTVLLPSHRIQKLPCSSNTRLIRKTACCEALGANEQQAATVSVEGEQVQLPGTHRRGILQGMLGTAAITITSPTANAADQQSATVTDPNNQQLSAAGSTSGRSLGDADACNAVADGGSGSSCCQARGAAAARDPNINSGCATPASVRQQQQLAGLVPPRQVGLDVEVLRAQAALDACCTDLEKHRLLVTLKETNQAAFNALLQQDLEGLLPLVYTPTIGDACLAWGSLLPRPTGLYITSNDRGKVDQVLQHWPSDEVRLAVVTDGERILGLGDLGAHGMGIPTGKCVVYGAAGAPPSWLLPITVDVGTNNAALLADPLYVGQPQQRLRGQPYQQLMLEVVQGLQKRFKRQVLVHWEDLAVSNAFNVLQLSQGAGVPTFNDDIQATAAVAVAAVLGGVQQRWLFFGAGQASLGTARLLVQALQQHGLPRQQQEAPQPANNCLVFPGLGLGAVQSGTAAVTDGMLLAAAQAVAGMVTAEELRQECVLPRIGRLQEVAQAVAASVSAEAARGTRSLLA
ncbi:hypothetical protein COO60DRAFT_1702001 [Scenedesmus sp. NREL 46B-D3]|nr:hypothetical protein COO60DRAFT_1702001 [Scenedesmus sp. NREL 46B-D3]